MKNQSISKHKTRKVAHYIIAHTEPSQLGATKLYKVMWYADVLHYRRYGETISGQVSYVRMDKGPVPNGIYEALDSLKDNQTVFEQQTPAPVGNRREFICLKRAEASWFSSTEIETLHEAIDVIVRLSAKEASNRTHGPIWEELLNGEQMPVRAAAVIPSDVSPEDIELALDHKAEFAR